MFARSLVFCAVSLISCDVVTCAELWTEFRGPTGQGISEAEKLPITWSATENITWKAPIPGSGWSSPVVYRDRIFLTSALPVEGNADGDYTLRALCLDAASGEILWNTEIFAQSGKDDVRIHGKNSHASPTPVVYGNRLYAHFGHQGSACLELDGRIVWKTQEVQYQPVHGNGGSPLVMDAGVIFSCDGATEQWLVALDRASGSLLWKTERPTDFDRKFSFSTPLLIDVDGQQQIVSPGSGAVCAFSPDGKELWRVRYDGYSVIPRPVFGHGLLYISTGYDRPQVMAIRVGGAGDITDTHVAWKLDKGAPNTPSLLLAGDELYMVSDRGIASCVDAKTGEVHWQERIGGNFSASPLYAGGCVYLQSEQGDGIVLKADKKFEKLATNSLGERTLASYAVDGKALLIRGESHLYRVEVK